MFCKQMHTKGLATDTETKDTQIDMVSNNAC